MERTQTTAKDFRPIVKAELRQRGWGTRTLARRCNEVHGKGVEHWRRSLMRWLNDGMKPSLENRQDVAEALGFDRDMFNINGDDDEEEAQVGDLVSALHSWVRQAVRVEQGRAV